ncbi:flagellar assembly protein FliW [Clostridium sp. P21]|uniref:Flagellar assembly factor FliW n=1 Tax=Clostridium muellerianum TaxID=2716538 RepID=A0A7Y0EEZ9_9CLOT|nr:flagellar assembly protein FliW [Clostridium muellerianum]NMM61270.1 flagellar assembly protein FliW [Clostridium muellerianum]
MELSTKYHGIVEYDESDVITFEKGIPGFERLKKFIIFPAEENEVFNILHSIEDETIGLVVVSPFLYIKDYEFNLDDEKLKELQIEKEEDLLILNTVTVSTNVSDITVNLKAPIVINIKKKTGEQIILDNPNYATKHLLFQK